MKKQAGMYTFAIHANGRLDQQFGALATPIYATSTFVFENAEQGGARFSGKEQGYIYSRLGNPTVTFLEQKIAALEGAEDAAMAASGMGAISSAIWTAIRTGDHIVANKMLYGCTYSFLNHGLARMGVSTTFVDMSNIEEVKNALKPNTKVLYIETPANPDLKITDIEAVSQLAHAYNKEIIVICDNTFASPICQRPLSLGCDVVVHSATKYLNGHGDVIAGAIAGNAGFISECKKFALKDMTGATLGAFEAYLILRGLKTLPLRVIRHCENAMKLAEYLETNPYVSKVYYPGLASFDGHAMAAEQMQNGFGGVLSFEIKGGIDAGRKLINNVELATIAVSLGDCETLIEHPASMTHATYSAEDLAKFGLSEGLIRVAVGLEDIEDIIADFDQAIQKSQQ